MTIPIASSRTLSSTIGDGLRRGSAAQHGVHSSLIGVDVPLSGLCEHDAYSGEGYDVFPRIDESMAARSRQPVRTMASSSSARRI